MKLIIIPGRCLGPLIILFFIHHGLAQENTLARLNAFSTGRVYRDKVEPHWFDGDSKFWYRVDVAARQHEFILVDAEKGSRQPAKCLSQLCAALGLPFQESMLHWPPGPRDTDGIWAKHWYNAVEKSTGFQPYTSKNKPLPDHLRKVYEECLPFYEKLYALRIIP